MYSIVLMKDFNRDHKYNRNDNKQSSGRFGRDSDRFDNRTLRKFERSTVTCDACGQKCEVPFKPTEGKPVYCSACFKKPGSSPRPHQSHIELDQINEKLDKIMRVLNIE